MRNVGVGVILGAVDVKGARHRVDTCDELIEEELCIWQRWLDKEVGRSAVAAKGGEAAFSEQDANDEAEEATHHRRGVRDN